MVASTLSAGNVAVIGFNTAQSDGSGQPATTNAIQFVLLAPIGSGTQIFFTDRSFPRSVLALYVGLAWLLTAIWRSFVQRFYRPQARRVALVGCGRAAVV